MNVGLAGLRRGDRGRVDADDRCSSRRSRRCRRRSAAARRTKRSENTRSPGRVEEVLLLGLRLGHGTAPRCSTTGSRPMTSRHRSRATLVAMTPGSHARPAERAVPRAREPRRRWTPGGGSARRWWCCCAAALFVVSAHNSEGTDLRPGRYTDLAVAGRAARPGSTTRLAGPGDRPQRRGRGPDRAPSNDTRGRSATSAGSRRSRTPPGWSPRTGPGVTVTLSDAPAEVVDVQPARTSTCLVVHQQDIQAVVNAMWKGGATAVTIQGQRVVTTTGIKCEGNAVQLQGVPYSQPYVISAVGDPAALLRRDRRATTTCSSTASRPPSPTSPSAGSSSSRTRSPPRRTTACSTSPTPSRCADRGRGSPGRARGWTRRDCVRRRRGRRPGRQRRASAVGRLGGRRGRRLVGSSNDETTIVTVEPCGGGLAAGRALLDDRALRLGGVGRTRPRSARSPASRIACSASCLRHARPRPAPSRGRRRRRP